MNCGKKLFCAALVALCSACDSSYDALFEPNPFRINNGPLSSDEIHYFTSKFKDPITVEIAECVAKEAEVRALEIGDPETLDPTKVELLPAERWSELDKPGKRLILTQVVINQVSRLCIRGKSN